MMTNTLTRSRRISAVVTTVLAVSATMVALSTPAGAVAPAQDFTVVVTAVKATDTQDRDAVDEIYLLGDDEFLWYGGSVAAADPNSVKNTQFDATGTAVIALYEHDPEEPDCDSWCGHLIESGILTGSTLLGEIEVTEDQIGQGRQVGTITSRVGTPTDYTYEYQITYKVLAIE